VFRLLCYNHYLEICFSTCMLLDVNGSLTWFCQNNAGVNLAERDINVGFVLGWTASCGLG
jgi:hypothetical protein